MRNTLALCWALLSLCVAAADASVGAAEPVDMFIGTEGLGHVSPAACSPFGAVQAEPDTSSSSEKYVGDWAHTSGYQHGDEWHFYIIE